MKYPWHACLRNGISCRQLCGFPRRKLLKLVDQILGPNCRPSSMAKFPLCIYTPNIKSTPKNCLAFCLRNHQQDVPGRSSSRGHNGFFKNQFPLHSGVSRRTKTSKTNNPFLAPLKKLTRKLFQFRGIFKERALLVGRWAPS